MTLKERFPFISAHKLPMFLLACGVAFILWQMGGGIVGGIKSGLADRRAAQTEEGAAREEATASAATSSANAASVDRQVEDRVRAETITPRVTRTKEQTRKAQADYEATRNSYRRPDVAGSALHERNCADLAALYESERFDFCR
jgi:hypothetical protein